MNEEQNLKERKGLKPRKGEVVAKYSLFNLKKYFFQEIRIKYKRREVGMRLSRSPLLVSHDALEVMLVSQGVSQSL